MLMASIILKKNKYLPLKLPNLTPDCSSNSAPFQTKLAQIPYLLMPHINITDRTHIIMHPLLSPSPTTTVTTVPRITLDGVRKPSSCLSAFLRRERLQDTFVVSDWTLGKQQPEHQQRMLACLWLLCLRHLKSADSWSKFFLSPVNSYSHLIPTSRFRKYSWKKQTKSISVLLRFPVFRSVAFS